MTGKVKWFDGKKGYGFIPLVIKIAEMAAPIGNVPSTVKSATSNTRKVMNTPTANKDHKRPVVMVPTTKSNIKISSIISYLYEVLQEL